MMEMLRAALDDRDLLLFVADAAREFVRADAHAVDLAKKSETPVILVLNKIDLLPDKSRLLALIDKYRELHDFAEYIPVSAASGENLDLLRKAIVERLPEGPAYFPPDHMTDQPERFLAAELVREKILHETQQEVPHSVAVLVDKWEETDGLIRIYRDHLRGEGRPKRNPHRRWRREAQAHRHTGARGDGAIFRPEDLPRSARQGATGVA